MTPVTGHYKTEITFNGDTDVGHSRQNKPNQDSFDTYEHYCTDQVRLAAKGKLFVVADGMGGSAGGKEASSIAVDVVFRTFYADPDVELVPSLERAIQAANTQIQQHGRANPELRGLGTTVVVAVIRDRTLVVGNVGDSRAYLLHNGELSQLSHDHTMVQEQVREGLLTPEEALSHPRRHVLSRNLGYRPKAAPDFDTRPLVPGDTILLCSDGLWGTIDDAELAAMLRQYRGDAAVQRLIDLANERGGPDNISAVVIHVDSMAPSAAFGTTERLEPADDQPGRSQQASVGMQIRATPGAAKAHAGEPVPSSTRNGTSPSSTTGTSVGREPQPLRWQPGRSAAIIAGVMLLLIGAGVYLGFNIFASQPASGSNPVRDGLPAAQLTSTVEQGEQAGTGATSSEGTGTKPAPPLTPVPSRRSPSKSTITLPPIPAASPPAATPPSAMSTTGVFQKVGELNTGEVVAQSAALSENAKLLAIGSPQGRITLWQLPDRVIKASFEGSRQAINSLAFSEDGKWLASALEDGTVQLWELLPDDTGSDLHSPRHTSEPFLTFEDTSKAKPAPVKSVTFSSNERITSASIDAIVKQWKLGTPAPLASFGDPKEEVQSVAITPDGQTLIVVEPGGAVTVWGEPDNIVRTTFPHDGKVQAVAVTSDASTVAIVEPDGTVTLHDLNDHKILGQLKSYYTHNSVSSLAFTRNNRFLVITQANGPVEWWDVTQARLSTSHGNETGKDTRAGFVANEE